MELPVQVTFKGLTSSPALEARILSKAKKLDRFYDHVTSCRVLIEANNRQEHLGRLYNVRVDVTVPGAELVASREAGIDHDHEGVYVAVRDAFDAVIRQLEDHAQRRRGEVKRHAAAVK
jgi:ribosomal subunit interface protein